MPESISVMEDSGIILIKSSGKVGADDISNSLEYVVKASADHKIFKVLVDAREQEDLPSVTDLFRLGEAIAKKTRGFRHAIVVSQATPKNINFIDTVCFNRGANMKIFSCFDHALEWLTA